MGERVGKIVKIHLKNQEVGDLKIKHFGDDGM